MKKYYKAIKDFHDKYQMRGTNNEDMNFRINLLAEELGELSSAVTKGKGREEILEECVDLLNLSIGNFISLGCSLEEMEKVFCKKHRTIMKRKKKKIGTNNFRVSAFKD